MQDILASMFSRPGKYSVYFFLCGSLFLLAKYKLPDVMDLFKYVSWHGMKKKTFMLRELLKL